ncbi:C-C chemokine receptor type 4 [Amia ocellicauda]|uniref:C-C chemokine receptor type 4 n=1 Tax=Amia ocellicauda TaxID=2972642 RepID=UPI003464778A
MDYNWTDAMMDAAEPITEATSTDYDYNSSDYYFLQPTPCSTDAAITLGSYFKPVLYSVVFVLGLVGNSVVLLILIRCIKLKNMTDVCLLNLAISDLLLVLSLPFWAFYTSGYEVVSNVLCKTIVGMYRIGFFSSILFVTLMSIDRYLAIVHAVFAMRARTLCYGMVASIVTWTVAICGSIPEILITGLVVDEERLTCQAHYPSGQEKTWKLLHNFGENVLGLLLPLPILIYCYISILIVLLKSKNSNRHRAIKLIFMIVCVFVVFWLPYNVVLFLKSLLHFDIGNNCENTGRLELALHMTETVALIHCCVNPVIYAFVGEKFRKHLYNALSSNSACAYFFKHTAVQMRVSENETSNTPI